MSINPVSNSNESLRRAEEVKPRPEPQQRPEAEEPKPEEVARDQKELAVA